MLALISLFVWLYLFFAHGHFWRSTPELAPAEPTEFPDVDIVVPARNEAESIGSAVASLLAQDYAGNYRITVVDDNSTDGTGALAGNGSDLTVLRGQPKPAGWSGKLWALNQGIESTSAPILLFTDADIVHDPAHLTSLVAGLQQHRVEMVSEMVSLRCSSFAERALVPAFVYFFQMLYPFARVNDPDSKVAAAAGGTVLIRRQTLDRIGGIGAIREALIDDVTLAKAVKTVGPLYLGHSALARSLRAYPGFRDIWNMIARTAFTQLRYSSIVLGLTLAGLTVVWLVPLGFALCARGWPQLYGLCGFSLSAVSYMPTLSRYGRNRLWALCLPLIALFYMAATLGSALNHWFKRGVSWKDRAYSS